MHIPQVTDEWAMKVLASASSPIIILMTAGADGGSARALKEMQTISDDFDDVCIFLTSALDENPSLGTAWDITSTPCLVVFKDRRERSRLLGAAVILAEGRSLVAAAAGRSA